MVFDGVACRRPTTARGRRRRGVRGGVASARRPAAADPATARLLGYYGIGPYARLARATPATSPMSDALRGGAGRRRGAAAAAADRAAAQGALPGRQRAAARPRAAPGSPGSAWPGPATSRSTPATSASRWSRTSAAGRTSPSSRTSRSAPPAASATCATGSTAAACWSATPTPTSPTRTARPARHRRAARRLGRRDRPAARRPGRPATGRRVQRPPVRRLLAAALALRARPDAGAGRAGHARCGGPPRRAGALEVVALRRAPTSTPVRPRDYLAANLHAAGGGDAGRPGGDGHRPGRAVRGRRRRHGGR